MEQDEPNAQHAGPRLRHSKKRDVILAAFLQMDHVTAQDLYLHLLKKGHRITLGTIYRTMNLFCKTGHAQARHFGSQTQYDNVSHKGQHDHLICAGCGRIEEFEDKTIMRLEQEIAARNGFTLKRRKLEIYGLCPDCRP